jgi:cytochrome c
MSNKAYISFNQIDMSGIDKVVLTIFAPEQMLHAAGGTVEVHIDTPDGPVLGESSLITAQKGPVSPPVPIISTVNLKPTTGSHDVFLVYKNEKSAPGQPLFILLNVQYLYNAKTVSKAVAMK